MELIFDRKLIDISLEGLVDKLGLKPFILLCVNHVFEYKFQITKYFHHIFSNYRRVIVVPKIRFLGKKIFYDFALKMILSIVFYGLKNIIFYEKNVELTKNNISNIFSNRNFLYYRFAQIF